MEDHYGGTTTEYNEKGLWLTIFSFLSFMMIVVVLVVSVVWGQPRQALVGNGATGQQVGEIFPTEGLVSRNILGILVSFSGCFFCFALFGGSNWTKAGLALIATALVAGASLCLLHPLLQVAVALPGGTANATQVVGESGEYIPPILSLGALIFVSSIVLHFVKFMFIGYGGKS